jgi:hypothetical protein
MIRVGDKLVVGWGEPYALDVATRQAISLGTATIFVPAAEPNQVWMVDYGTRIGDREPQVWRVYVDSAEPLQDPIPLVIDGYPQIGIPGGLALQTETGLELWDIETGQATTLEADGPGFVHDVNGEVLSIKFRLHTHQNSVRTERQGPLSIDLGSAYSDDPLEWAQAGQDVNDQLRLVDVQPY